MAMKKCSVKQALEILSKESDLFSFQQPILKKEATPKIEIFEVKPIQHLALIQYLGSREIMLETAHLYCKEIWYIFKGRKYFALGLKNHLEGWELRNKYFKTSSSPKAYTFLKNHSDRLIILEGMFDLLSLAELSPHEHINSDVIVLNSLSFLQPVSHLFKNYNEVDLYLDNDQSGRIHSEELTNQFSNVKDKSDCYFGYKDLNEKLIPSINKQIRSLKNV